LLNVIQNAAQNELVYLNKPESSEAAVSVCVTTGTPGIHVSRFLCQSICFLFIFPCWF